jgi:hypothetical protein
MVRPAPRMQDASSGAEFASPPIRKQKEQLNQEESAVTKHTDPSVRLPGTTEAGSTALRSLLILGLSLAPAAAMADLGDAKTIASGLANPRGIAFAPNGALYVAEGGSGGPGPCIPSPVPSNGDRCYGETGAITRILPDGGVKRVLTGLPSLALGDGTVEGGVADVAFFGTTAFVTLGWGGNPADRASVGGKSALFGTLLQMAPSGKYKVLADIAGHEAEFNPAGGNVDSNPYNTLAQPGRRIVVDPGANALVEVLANGRTRTFAVPPPLPPVPPIPAPRESVPTSVVEGPDGAIYVGQLTSFPFWQGTSSVLRISSDGSTIEPYATGFTAVVDLAFDTGGALYVLEVARGQAPPFPPPNPGLGVGRLQRVCPGGAPEVLLDGLDYATGLAIGPDDAAYLTNRGASPTDGEVLRLPLTACP